MDSAEDYQQYLQGKEEAGRVPPDQESELDRQGLDELRDSQGREIEVGHIVQSGMSDRKYVVVGFGGGRVEVNELGPAKGYDAEELEVIGDLES
jgi:hypothetical protein